MTRHHYEALVRRVWQRSPWTGGPLGPRIWQQTSGLFPPRLYELLRALRLMLCPLLGNIEKFAAQPFIGKLLRTRPTLQTSDLANELIAVRDWPFDVRLGADVERARGILG